MKMEDGLNRPRSVKAQPALEFLSVYSWTLLAVILFVVVASVLASANSRTVYQAAHCYITPGFPCYGMYVMSNTVAPVSLVLFTNELGVTLSFPTNALAVNPTYANATYYGQCLPANALPGAVVACNATLRGFSTSLGTQLTPVFVISYKICGSTCSGSLPIYNTSGNADLAVSPWVAHFRNFIELANPATHGTVSPGNGTYNYGTQVSITASPIGTNAFVGWTCSGVGCYNGTATSNTVTLSNFIVETANFK